MPTEVVYRETRRKYRWPEVQLNIWIFVILAAASTVLGIFAWFIAVQQQLEIGVPWYVGRFCYEGTGVAHVLQDLSIRHCHGRLDAYIPPDNSHTGRTTTADTWGHSPGLVHFVRALAHYTD